MRSNDVYRTVSRALNKIDNMPEHSRKAMLSNLRRGIGRVPGDMPELWGILLQDLPAELQSKNGTPTAGEWAVYLALTLYALHQQGQENAMHQPGISLGRAVRQLADPESEPEESPSFRRFQTLLTASDIQEISHHLRGMIQLLRAKGIPLDYAKLAKDLYKLQYADFAPGVRLMWGQDYYTLQQDDTKCAIKEE